MAANCNAGSLGRDLTEPSDGKKTAGPSPYLMGVLFGISLALVLGLSACGGGQQNSTIHSPMTPPPPTNLTATAGNAQVSLSWSASSGATSYNVLRSTTSNGPYSNIATGVTTPSYTDTTVTNGTTYYYVVQAANSAGTSANSNQASATPTVPPPGTPTNLTATAGNAQVSLSWTASPGATSYNVLRSITSGGPYGNIATGVTTPSYTDTTVTNGTIYYYVVQAVNSSGTSGNSNQASATPTTPPAAPTVLTALPGNNLVALKWIASSGATSYNVLRSTTNGGPYSSIAKAVTATEYSDASAGNGTTYYYVVEAVNKGVASGNSNQASATPPGTLQVRVTANQANFYVYRDQDSGFNHGFPTGFFGNLGTISLDTGCVDDPSDTTTGCYSSTDTTALDTVHGTVMRVSFAPQPSGSDAGVNIEEPANWGVLSTNTNPPKCGTPYSCNPYDLTGATSVGFDIRSPDNARVQFGIGQSGGVGCTTQYSQPITSTWTTMTITLGPPDLNCTPDLSNVHILFSVATNDQHAPNGATVLLDNIQFLPVPARASQAPGTRSLPLSKQTFGVVPQASTPFPPDQVNRNFAAIYESALTIQALLNQGDTADAQEVADAFDYALYHDNEGDYISTSPGATSGCFSGAAAAQCGLHNAYDSGDIALLNDQNGGSGNAKADDGRLAGFTCPPGISGNTGFCLVLDGATGGNNAWAILSLLAEYKQSGNAKYLNDAKTIGNWIVKNLDASGTGYGGYLVGYPDQGAKPPKSLNPGKSTENNADIFVAMTALAKFDSNNASAWTSAANVAGDFVMQMFDEVNGRFNTGTVPVGTAPPPPGVCPTGPQKGDDVINAIGPDCDFLDADTFTTLAMAAAPRYANYRFPDGSTMDWRRPIQYVLNTFAQTVTFGGITFQGFDLVTTPLPGGANGIAWEFTGQAVETMYYVDQIYSQTTFESKADFYLEQMQLAQITPADLMPPFGDKQGLVDSTLQDGETLPPLDQCLSTPFQNCPPERVGLAATAWMTLAGDRINPLTVP